MAKRSKAQTEQTIQQILDEALKQVLSIGYESMSYTTLSTATGISRTGISHHFPRKAEFLIRLDNNMASIFIDELDFSDPSALELSWMEALNKPGFCAVLRLFFSLCGYSSREITMFKAIDMARDLANAKLGAPGLSIFNDLLGRSAVVLLAQASEINAQAA
ncbi:TetR family transcriptional regulator [Shewanella eurypsychrophilus]|uniref:TetR family transcriptional regulator n=1 Tax=Shewanella eurypsychrophilus TaxID=2593656 RepID=A0ABX6VA21_9GAMM|nr:MULTISPECIES: TetR family transcriptional regulator [Shewanella]QFU24326.1 TetR family transcriptional regulator [Shewanella sp. YLB-09]QPG59526.1 TetR family transcriptional regulator [Shewanella eurypsychrophilus]